MDNPEIWIALVIVGFLIFGAKRMPDAARGLGRSLRIFKAETKGLLTDDEQKAAATPPLRNIRDQLRWPAAQPYHHARLL